MWYIAAYQLVTPISLKLATATSTGGKSLLLPTPFAWKMALLDIVIQDAGLAQGMALWPQIRDATIAVHGPEQIVVNNTFTKVLKPVRGAPEVDPDTGLIPTFSRSIAFREYVLWQGDCRIAIDLPEREGAEWARWLTRIAYVGKRGGFIQALDAPVTHPTLEGHFTNLCTEPDSVPLGGTLQVMDDCGAELTFDQVNIYSSKAMRLGRERILRHVALPYRLERSSRSYTLYRRIQ